MAKSTFDVISGTVRRWLNYVNPNPETFDTEAFERRERYKPDYLDLTRFGGRFFT
jgi:hypothetical protein